MINVSRIDSISYPNEPSSEEASFADIPKLILITEKEVLELKNAVGYWKSLHHRAKEREEQLKLELLAKDVKIRDLKQRIFGKKSEKRGSIRNRNIGKSDKSVRPGGHQQGRKGHGRTQYPDLEIVDEKVALGKEMGICPECGKPFCSFGSEESELIEIDVKAYKRRIIRERKKKCCACKMEQMRTEFESFLKQPGKDIKIESIVLHEAKQKVPASLKNHWNGLSVFVQHP